MILVDEATMKLALEALMRSRKAVSGDLNLAGCAYGSNDPDGHRYDDAKKALVTLDKAITALRETLAEQPAAQQSVEAYSEIVAARFEAMQKRGDAWITTRAAAAIARDPRIPRIRVKEECQHSWTEESRANGWRSSCRLCGKEAAGSGQ